MFAKKIGTSQPSDLWNIEVEDLSTGAMKKMSEFMGKAMLVVNVASGCGFADETYTKLSQLHATYGSQGLAILGFPSNSFDQEHGDVEALISSTSRAPEFAFFRKVKVTGIDAHPLFSWLTAGGDPIRWNFEVFLISRSGELIKRWMSGGALTAPDGTAAVEAALAAKPAKLATSTADNSWMVKNETGSVCVYATAEQMYAMSPEELAEALTVPHVVSGLMSNWSALEEWSTAERFAARFGQHQLQTRRFVSLREKDVVTKSVAWVAENARDWHTVIVESAKFNTEEENGFMDDLQRDYDVPELLLRTTGTRVLGFGGGLGVRMANHGFAWLGVVAGAKRWYVAPPHVEKPPEPVCGCKHGCIGGADEDRYENLEVEDLGDAVGVCEQRVGEVMIVPTAFWHATCNLEPYTIGIGAQDSCGLARCEVNGVEQFCPGTEAELKRCFVEKNSHWTRSEEQNALLRNRKRLYPDLPQKAKVEAKNLDLRAAAKTEL